MEILNTTTGQVERVNYICNGQDISSIMLDSPEITFNTDEDIYQASDEEIRHWKTYFYRSELADEMENDLNKIIKEYQNRYPDISFNWFTDELYITGYDIGCDEADFPVVVQHKLKEMYLKLQQWWNPDHPDDLIEGYWRLEG